MTKDQALSVAYSGNFIDCTYEEYESEIRTALHDKAAFFIDTDQNILAMILLEEVKRLDLKLNFKMK